MASYLAAVSFGSNTNTTWNTISPNDSATAIKSLMFNNGSTNFVEVRLKNNTNISAQFGTGIFNLPRVNPGNMEIRSASTNTGTVLVCVGHAENPA